MTAEIVAKVGGAASNSYVTLAEADTYASSQPWEAQWDEFTEDQQTVALYQGVRWLETLLWVGIRCDPSTTDSSSPQALAWPAVLEGEG